MTITAPPPASGSAPETIAEFGAIGTAIVAMTGLIGVWSCLRHGEPLNPYASTALLAVWACGIVFQLSAAIRMRADEEDGEPTHYSS